MPQTFVITGATSFIGRRLTLQLLSEGQRVFAVCRNQQKASSILGQHEALTMVEASLKEYDQLSQKIPQADVFIHLAWEGTGHDGRNMMEVQLANIQHSKDALQQAVLMGCQLFVEAVRHHYRDDHV